MNWKHKINRIIKYEYWSMYVFYFPFIPVWLFLGLLHGNVLYFTRVNRLMNFGGLWSYSKFNVLEKIKDQYKVKSKLYNKEELSSASWNHEFKYPFICKPDIGARGKDVHLIKQQSDLDQAMLSLDFPVILQEYIEFPIELGVLYYRYPNGGSGISSVVGKEFLTITGDGRSTLKELISKNIRAASRLDYLEKKHQSIWNSAIENGRIIELEPIGNHNRGTTFIDRTDLINDQLIAVFDTISASIPDFQYGRYDLRVDTIDNLYAGKNIRIIELNGMNSEAAHIYDPKYNIIKAYYHVLKNLLIGYRISNQLKAQGIKPGNSWKEFKQALKIQLNE